MAAKAMSGYYRADWFVWSFEHNAWWGPNRGGYYTEVRAAGLYTEKEAMEIVRSANRGGERNEEARHISTQAEHIRYALERYQKLAAVLNGDADGNQAAAEVSVTPSASEAP